MRLKLFLIMFGLGMALFAAVNVYDFSKTRPPCCDFGAEFGLPFPLGTTGGFVGGTHIHLTGLLLDTLIALGASILFAVVIERLSRLHAVVRVARRVRRRFRRGLKNYLDAAR